MQPHWYEKQTLESILTLLSVVGKLNENNFQKMVANTIRYSFYFTTATDFFGQKYKLENTSDKDVLLLMSRDPDVLFVGGLLLKIISILHLNAKPVSVKVFNCKENHQYFN